MNNTNSQDPKPTLEEAIKVRAHAISVANIVKYLLTDEEYNDMVSEANSMFVEEMPEVLDAIKNKWVVYASNNTSVLNIEELAAINAEAIFVYDHDPINTLDNSDDFNDYYFYICYYNGKDVWQS